jgi:hypothetical protein
MLAGRCCVSEAACNACRRYARACPIVVAKIVRREGWDDIPTAGDPGEYLKWQLVDGGTLGRNGDVCRLQYCDYDSFVEYWPTYPDGGCDDFQGDAANCPDYGNLVMHSRLARAPARRRKCLAAAWLCDPVTGLPRVVTSYPWLARPLPAAKPALRQRDSCSGAARAAPEQLNAR